MTSQNRANNFALGFGNKAHSVFHDIRRTVKTNMLNAGIDKTHRDVILGHALQGMDTHYISPDEDTLKEVMRTYTRWLDEQMEKAAAIFDYSLDQTGFEES